MICNVYTQRKDKIFQPSVEEGVTWELERKGVPGKLTFKVLKDNVIDIHEGDPVMMSVDGVQCFYGFVFVKKRDKDGIITVTAYDQLRYLKNKINFKYKGKKASEVVKMLAADVQLQCGDIEDTGFVIEEREEANKTLFDVILTALDLTVQNAGEMYVLYDDYGKLTLKNIVRMKLPLLIDAETGENFDYTTSIDGETYNQIQLYYENKETGERKWYEAKNTDHMNKWGVLRHLESIDEKTNGQAKADALLKLHDQKTRNLTVKGCFGDIRVRGGSMVMVSLNLGDIVANQYLMVEKVKHTFKNNEHSMDLTLRGSGVGGDFVV